MNVEKLLANPDKITNALLREAVEDVTKKNNEAKKLELIRALDIVQRTTAEYVSQVREIRKREKEAKAILVKYAEAEERFLKDGDIAKYAETVHGKGTYAEGLFLRSFPKLVAQ